MYKFLRLGRDGYTKLCASQMAVAAMIRRGLAEMLHTPTGRPLFTLLDAGDKGCLPVVAAQFNKASACLERVRVTTGGRLSGSSLLIGARLAVRFDGPAACPLGASLVRRRLSHEF